MERGLEAILQGAVAIVVTIIVCMLPYRIYGDSQTAAGWCQGIGSVAAVLVAIWVSRKAAIDARLLADQLRAKDVKEKIATVDAIFNEIVQILGLMQDPYESPRDY